MADRLAALLEQFPVSAEMFHAGRLCGTHLIGQHEDDGAGQLHLLRRGALEIHYAGVVRHVDVPSVLLFPRSSPRRFVADSASGVELACAQLRFEGGATNPLRGGLPDLVCLPLSEVAGADAVLPLLFDEAFSARCGRVAVVNRMVEVAMVLVLRQLMESGTVGGGLLAGLADARLRLALVAMHERPREAWSLPKLAEVAGMSRSVFAERFRDALGVTPAHYLQAWRVALAQRALRRGVPIKRIAETVGYGSEAALTRAFKAQVGEPPRAWRQRLGAHTANAVSGATVDFALAGAAAVVR